METLFDRRLFLGLAAAGLGGAAFGASELEASDAPAPAQAASNGRILIAYATRCGSTREIAQELGRDLKNAGGAVDVRQMDKTLTVAGYELILLGSAVRYGKWLSEAVDFVRLRQADLRRKRTALFTVHMQNTGADEASREARLAYLDGVHACLQPRVEAFFAGRFDFARLSFGERMLCKLIKAKNADLRDWPAIHAWAKTAASAA